MLFVTNRFPTQSIRTRLGRKFTFDLQNNAASNSVFFCEKGDGEDHVEIGSLAFLQRLKDSDYRQILVYLHGFNTLPEKVFETTDELQALCNKEKKNEVLVVPAVWPCDNDLGVVGDYWDDQRSADLSGFSFARVLAKFLAWRTEDANHPDVPPCLKRINLLAHSMGGRVLRQTLLQSLEHNLPHGIPMIFRNTFLAAADVVNETLHKGERGESISHASRNVVVYHASDDLALRASKAVNLKNGVASRRLGHTGPEDMGQVPRNIYEIDCDNVNLKYDVPDGHNYFASGQTRGKAGLIFKHMFQSMESGRVFPGDPEQRSFVLKSD